MSDLKNAILDARYVDMIDLADFIARDCDLPLRDENGDFLPRANEISAAIFRWAANASVADQPDVRPLNVSKQQAQSQGGFGRDMSGATLASSFDTIATKSREKGRSAS